MCCREILHVCLERVQEQNSKTISIETFGDIKNLLIKDGKFSNVTHIQQNPSTVSKLLKLSRYRKLTVCIII